VEVDGECMDRLWVCCVNVSVGPRGVCSTYSHGVSRGSIVNCRSSLVDWLCTFQSDFLTAVFIGGHLPPESRSRQSGHCAQTCHCMLRFIGVSVRYIQYFFYKFG